MGYAWSNLAGVHRAGWFYWRRPPVGVDREVPTVLAVQYVGAGLGMNPRHVGLDLGLGHGVTTFVPRHASGRFQLSVGPGALPVFDDETPNPNTKQNP